MTSPAQTGQAQTRKRKPRNSPQVNLLLSVALHTVIILALVYVAAREGLLGKQIKKIAVEMVKEKPPEKPKVAEKPKTEPPKLETPKANPVARVEAPKAQPPPIAPAAPAPTEVAPAPVAPPPVDVSSFVFEGGKAVMSSSDPVQLYKGLLETALRSHWERPVDMDDRLLSAEIEVSVDSIGHLSDPVWKKSSGDSRWDKSVREAIARTTSVSRPPPANFPTRVPVVFDVVQAETIGQ